MRSTMSIFKNIKAASRSKGAVVNYTRQDLTNKWLNRVQAKVSNSQAQEAVSKLSSLIAYYTKPSDSSNEKIDWNFWSQNIRSEGIVNKLKDKLESVKDKTYNVEALAAKSAVVSDKYENVGLFLKYNHDLWMKHYTDNLDALYNSLNVGDWSKLSQVEMFSYAPGAYEVSAGWRETGYIMQTSVYYENSTNVAATNQFRYANNSLQPYYHPVCAWERGLVCKHALYSL